jgi:hypothetical protein
MDDLLKQIQDYLPIAIVAATYGGTFAIKTVFSDPLTDKAPRWLLLVPFLLGGALGTAANIITTGLEALVTQPLWYVVTKSVYNGFGMGGASVILWEAKKLIADAVSQRAGQ